MRQKSSSMFARLSIELYRSMQTLYNHWPLMLGSRYPWNPILWVVTIFEAHFLATFLCSLCLNLIDQNPFNSTYFNSGEDKKKRCSLVHNSLPALQASLLVIIQYFPSDCHYCWILLVQIHILPPWCLVVRSGAQASPAGMDTQFFEAVATKIPCLGRGALWLDMMYRMMYPLVI